MKPFLLIILMLFSLRSIAQDTLKIPNIPFDPESGEYAYVDINEVSGTKDEIFSKLNEWVALNFKDARNVIQMNDKSSGKLVAKGSYKDSTYYRFLGKRYVPYYITFTLNFTVKDGKYRVIMSDFDFEKVGQDHSGMTVKGSIGSKIKNILKYNGMNILAYEYNEEFSLKAKAEFEAEILRDVDNLARTFFSSIRQAANKKIKDGF